MFSFFTEYRFMPCAACGEPIDCTQPFRHVCDPDRRLEHELFLLRDEIAAFDEQVGAFLDSPAGRFEVWIAERDRPRC